MVAGCVFLLGLALQPADSTMVPPPPDRPEDAVELPQSEEPEAPSSPPDPEPEPLAEPEALAEPSPAVDDDGDQGPDDSSANQVSPPGHDDEASPLQTDHRQTGGESEEVAEGPVHRGFVLSGMLGYAGCGKPWCQGYRGGFGGGAEAGVRFGRIMPVVTWTSGIGPYNRATLEDEVGLSLNGKPQVRMHVIGAGVTLFPLGKDNRRIDPHFDARIGYGWVRLEFEGEGLAVTERVKRGVFTLGGGVDGYVTDNFSIGARIDMHVMFAGEACISVRGQGGASASACQDSDDLESRVDPRDWPLPFSVMIQFRRIWGF
jgi:opacity protein-like surface antigen